MGINDKIISELQNKLYTIKQLKDMIKNNISGENQTQRTYADQMRTAQKVGNASIEYILKDISIQESKHADSFKRVMFFAVLRIFEQRRKSLSEGYIR